MPKFQTTPEAYQLLHDGTLALSHMEHNGVRVDKGYLDATIAQVDAEIAEGERILRNDPIYQTTWKKRFGVKANLTAPAQLGEIIFECLGHHRKQGSKGLNDELAFENVNDPFVKDWFRIAKLRKGRNTYLEGIRRELVQDPVSKLWFVHPSYNLNTVSTFRSSCDNPNWQNVPVRNARLAEMIRRCYIPRPGNEIIENDYGQIEVRVSACHNLDPALLNYILSGADMHQDMAAQIFMLDSSQVSKEARHIAKNQCVFPFFYGSIATNCARFIWDALAMRNVKLKDGSKTIIEHMASKGIKSCGACVFEEEAKPGTFEYHLKQVEKDFWNRRFKVYADWKRSFYNEYLQNGGYMMKTGFAVNLPLAKNDVTNWPIQGSAFHCLLWSLPRIINRLRRYKMKSLLVGQIHDCAVGDCKPSERNAYINILREIMMNEVRKAWDWIIVPLDVEAEITPVDGSWFEKKVHVEVDGNWVLKG